MGNLRRIAGRTARDRGVTSAEYAIIAFFVLVVIAVAVGALGSKLLEAYTAGSQWP